MEKIMNILKPGKTQDDETLYGSGHGEGSHFANTTNTPNTANPISSSNQHASGVGNTGLGATPSQTAQAGHHAGQGSHLAGATPGQTSTLPIHSSGVTTTTTTSTHTSQSHLGRDAGLAGATGAGTGVHGHQGHDSGLSSTHHTGSHGSHATSTANMLDPAVNTRARGHEDGIHHDPISGGGAEEADAHHGKPLTESAIAMGRGQHQTGTGIGRNTNDGPAPHTAGPHQKDIANVLDPRVNPNNAAEKGAQATSGHHYGRDAALGAGAVGAAGLASQHHQNQNGSGFGTSNNPNIHQSTTGTSGLSSGLAPNTAGPHRSDMLNRADPRVTANPTTAQGNPQAQSGLGQSDRSHASTGGYAAQPSIPHDKDHNYGKDAAIAGGVTSAFVGAGHHGQTGHTDPTRVGPHGATSQDPYSTSSTQHSTVTAGHSNDHHLGRDAAVAGGAAGVGGAAYEANQHKHDKELAKAQKEAEKEYKHDQKKAEKDHKIEDKRAEKHADKDEKKKHGFLSFLHRDKNKKYSAEEEADFERQEREHNDAQSHTGRNAALGGAVVGGAGAYAAGHHHEAPGNHGIGTGAGTQNALAGNTSSTGHDSATHGTPLPLKPAGKDIGDILHGVERNRGVTGSAGFHEQPGFGDGHPGHPPSSTDQQGHPIGSGTTGTGYGSQQTGREFPLGSQSQHTARDAAALGGAGLVGEHEYRKHDTTTGQHSGLTGSQGYDQHNTTGYGQENTGLGSSTGQYDNTSSGLTDSKTSDLSGRNRLHKDPPASHPAAQTYSGNETGSHVPGSGSERERLVGQGRDHLDRDTGVANAPPANSGSNY